MPLSRGPNVVARSPFLYDEVPSTMSFSVWPITRRQNRMPTFADTPVGRLLASGPLGGEDEDDPERGAALDDGLDQPGGLVLVVGVGEEFLALVDEHRDQEQAECAASRQLRGDLVLRAQLPGQLADGGRAGVEQPVQVAQRVHAGVEGGGVGAAAVVVGSCARPWTDPRCP